MIKPLDTGKESCTAKDKSQLEKLVALQRKKANADVAGGFWIGVPVGSIGSENYEADIAELMHACGVEKIPAKGRVFQ